VRIGAIGAVIAGLALGGEKAADAKCVDVGCIVGWVYVVAVPVIIGGVTVFIVNVYETATDIGEAGSHRVPSNARATFETGWGSVQAGIFGAIGVGLIANDDVETAFGLFALSAWPLGLGMHGAWGTRGDPYSGFPMQVLPVAAVDLAVAGYDVVRLAQRDKPATGYGVIEVLGALPQMGLGIAAAAGGRREDLAPTLALTALPTLLFAHGVYVMAAKPYEEPSHATDAPTTPPPPVTWRLLPTIGREVTGSNVGLSVVGRF
jgi:hypothetical protein